MSHARLALLSLATLATLGLGGCATAPSMSPTEVLRYHLDAPIQRGTISVQPVTGSDAPASLEFKTYAAAVESQLLKLGYTLPAPGTQPDYVAAVSFTRTTEMGPPRRSPFSLSLGAGGFSGGRGGGLGLGGGVGIPFGGAKQNNVLVAELSVTIKNRTDMSPIWEGHARGISDIKTADQQAGRLAAALFTGFPGESGRTITVK